MKLPMAKKSAQPPCAWSTRRECSPWVAWLKFVPFFDNLRSDPRYADLIRRGENSPKAGWTVAERGGSISASGGAPWEISAFNPST
jgi:hypothetical protein